MSYTDSYGGGDYSGRDAIAQALMKIQNPPPAPQMPQLPMQQPPAMGGVAGAMPGGASPGTMPGAAPGAIPAPGGASPLGMGAVPGVGAGGIGAGAMGGAMGGTGSPMPGLALPGVPGPGQSLLPGTQPQSPY